MSVLEIEAGYSTYLLSDFGPHKPTNPFGYSHLSQLNSQIHKIIISIILIDLVQRGEWSRLKVLFILILRTIVLFTINLDLCLDLVSAVFPGNVSLKSLLQSSHLVFDLS